MHILKFCLMQKCIKVPGFLWPHFASSYTEMTVCVKQACVTNSTQDVNVPVTGE